MKNSNPVFSKSGAGQGSNPSEAVDFSLADLHLDLQNPRFGRDKGSKLSERELVNVIADDHDISDVLSSISANGYFHSEPLIGAKNKNKQSGITIVEGNRRLAACLILAGDPRAVDQTERRLQYASSRFTATTKLPVFVYEWQNKADRLQLLPYLGIRHIVGPLQWDSYAKAAWLASVIEERVMDVEGIIRMTGDKNRTIVRLLDGYYFVNQVEETRTYVADGSNRHGRGSKIEYPFSWVYNALDYDSVRQFIGLGPRARIPGPNPIPVNGLDRAGELMTLMFGDKQTPAAIADSRELKDLAKALSQPESLRELRKGQGLYFSLESARPKRDRAIEKLQDAADTAEEAFGLMIGVTTAGVTDLLPHSNRLFQASKEIRDRLRKIEAGDEGED